MNGKECLERLMEQLDMDYRKEAAIVNCDWPNLLLEIGRYRSLDQYFNDPSEYEKVKDKYNSARGTDTEAFEKSRLDLFEDPEFREYIIQLHSIIHNKKDFETMRDDVLVFYLLHILSVEDFNKIMFLYNKYRNTPPEQQEAFLRMDDKNDADLVRALDKVERYHNEKYKAIYLFFSGGRDRPINEGRMYSYLIPIVMSLRIMVDKKYNFIDNSLKDDIV